MNRGSVPLDVATVNEPMASMRPRFMNRGSHEPTPQVEAVVRELQ